MIRAWDWPSIVERAEQRRRLLNAEAGTYVPVNIGPAARLTPSGVSNGFALCDRCGGVGCGRCEYTGLDPRFRARDQLFYDTANAVARRYGAVVRYSLGNVVAYVLPPVVVEDGPWITRLRAWEQSGLIFEGPPR
jgi:hypothetical protein